jgi:HAD superfamily hydrolase (TIGR01509 family)
VPELCGIAHVTMSPGNFEDDSLPSAVATAGIPFLSCSNGRFKNVCFDIGGVLLVPNLDKVGLPMSAFQFKRMLRSHAWLQYHEGRLSWTETRRQLALEMGQLQDDHCDEASVQAILDGARASLQPVTGFVRLVNALHATGKLKLFCMTNAAKEDHDDILARFPDVFRKFDRIFYSAAVGLRKPNFGFFEHALREMECEASETVFVDDTIQNVVVAESLGFTGVLVRSHDEEGVKEAVNLVVYHLRSDEEKWAAAVGYLAGLRGSGRMVEICPSLTSDGIRVPVHFDHFLVAELLTDPGFLPMHKAPVSGTFNHFPPMERLKERDPNTNAVTHKSLPDDLDTTSTALSVLHKFSKVDMETIHVVLDKMVDTQNSDGIFQV